MRGEYLECNTIKILKFYFIVNCCSHCFVVVVVVCVYVCVCLSACVRSCFCYAILCVLFLVLQSSRWGSFAIISLGTRELVGFVLLSSGRHVAVII